MEHAFDFDEVFGVDFSGAALAGKNAWLARLVPAAPGARAPLRLALLANLEALAGDARRGPALAHLVERVASSRNALWGIDAPFALPVELSPGFAELARHVRAFDGDAIAFGRDCVVRARALGGAMHLRRATELASRTPFNAYHYRIIHQTFHVVRDVLAPLAQAHGTAILPFEYARLAGAERVVVEACPSSTLKRLGLPHQGYKQTAPGPIAPEKLAVRRVILRALAPLVAIAPRERKVILANPGGDALDAVLAAVGARHGFEAADHASLARDARATREGFVFA